MFIKKPAHRKFDYQPRYYNPKEDETEKRKRRLGFKYNKKSGRGKNLPVAYIIMLLIILYIFLKYNGYF